VTLTWKVCAIKNGLKGSLTENRPLDPVRTWEFPAITEIA